MAVSIDDVKKIASLARLRVSDDRLPVLANELNGILAHMDALSQIDTSAVEPTMGGETRQDVAPDARGMRLRDDVVASVPLAIEPSQLTQRSQDGFILVPRLSTHGDA